MEITAHIQETISGFHEIEIKKREGLMENTERERRYKKLQLKLEELQKRRDLKFYRKIGIIAGVLFAAVLFLSVQVLHFIRVISFL